MRVRRDCRASIRHDKVVDGSDALPDENAQERKYRNGAARLGLQHETGDAHSGSWRIDGSDPRLRQAARSNLSGLLNHKRSRFYTTWTHKRHRELNFLQRKLIALPHSCGNCWRTPAL